MVDGLLFDDQRTLLYHVIKYDTILDDTAVHSNRECLQMLFLLHWVQTCCNR